MPSKSLLHGNCCGSTRCTSNFVIRWFGPPSSKRMTVKLDESHGHALSIDGAEPTGYGLGKAGWVTVPLRAPGISVALLRDWIEESYCIVAPKRFVEQLGL